MEFLNKLNEKFSKNIGVSTGVNKQKLEEVESKAKAIYYVGSFLNKNGNNNNTRKEITAIFDEVFSDLTISIYLSTCSIHNPSLVLLRRVMELGIAIPYFWDKPHKFWAWKKINTHETDFSFKDGIEYLSSLGYKEYLKNEFEISDSLIYKDKVNKLYRELSNTIHGKFDTFESAFSESYSFNLEKYSGLLNKILEVENILLSCYKARFKDEHTLLISEFPAIERYSYEY